MNNLDQFIHKDYIKQELEFSKISYYLDRYVVGNNLISSTLKENPKVVKDNTIWFMWLQGINNAPILVKKCYESICRNKPKEFDIVLITEENMKEYITLPNYIWDKYVNGAISKTHLSDIVRVELLYTYGGCWIDSTVFCMGEIPTFMISGELFMFKLAAVVTKPTLKMSSWWIYARNKNRIISEARSILWKYWENEDSLQNYFLLHIIISKIIEEDSTCNAIFNAIPYFNSGNAHVLWGKMGQQYDSNEWNIIKQTSVIQKLSYKNRFLKGDMDTFYEFITREIIE